MSLSSVRYKIKSKNTLWGGAAAFLGLLALLPVQIEAHGVEGRIESGGVVVAASYQGGEVMSHARVTVQAPDSGKTYQKGNTDRNGRFAFAPDKPGTWRLVIADDMGHRLDFPVVVEANHLGVKTSQPAASSLGTAVKAFFGVSLILFVAAVALWWKARRDSRQGQKVRT